MTRLPRTLFSVFLAGAMMASAAAVPALGDAKAKTRSEMTEGRPSPGSARSKTDKATKDQTKADRKTTKTTEKADKKATKDQAKSDKKTAKTKTKADRKTEKDVRKTSKTSDDDAVGSLDD